MKTYVTVWVTCFPSFLKQQHCKKVFENSRPLAEKLWDLWPFILSQDDFYTFFRYVFWYHNARMINFDSERGIAVTTTPGRRTHSQLSIQKAEVADSGNYTCAPSNSLPASIQVFVSGMSGK